MPLTKQVVCLAGGVGAAKFVEGLVNIMPREDVTVIVNTGDDIELHGLHVSPDLDIITYTLAGIVDREKRWGVEGDTFNSLAMLRKYGLETWFRLGDKDLATHIYRTQLLQEGRTLHEVTRMLCRLLRVEAKVLPMTNQKVTSQILTDAGKMHFEEYLVKRESKDKVYDVVFEGADVANPAPEVVESIRDADGVIVCPSNPIVSIGPILAVKPIRRILEETGAKVAAISPIVGGVPLKGPADKLMHGLGLEVSAYSIASLYRDFLDVFVLDEVDKRLKTKIENLGVKTILTNTVMRSLADKAELARTVLKVFE